LPGLYSDVTHARDGSLILSDICAPAMAIVSKPGSEQTFPLSPQDPTSAH